MIRKGGADKENTVSGKPQITRNTAFYRFKGNPLGSLYEITPQDGKLLLEVRING